jgi:hypothetical protein
MGLASEFGDAAWPVFDEWSRDAKNYDAKENRTRWKSFKSGGGSLHEAAASSVFVVSASVVGPHRWFFTTSSARLASAFRADAGTDRTGGAMYETQIALQPSCRALTLPVRARSLPRGAETLETKLSSSLPSHFLLQAAAGMA